MKIFHKHLIPFILFVFVFSQLQAQRLNRTEKKIVEKVQSYSEESINFLEKVVNINSGTMNIEGVKAVGNVFSEAFDAIDFDTRWIEMPTEMNRAGHLFASI